MAIPTTARPGRTLPASPPGNTPHALIPLPDLKNVRTTLTTAELFSRNNLISLWTSRLAQYVRILAGHAWPDGTPTAIKRWPVTAPEHKILRDIAKLVHAGVAQLTAGISTATPHVEFRPEDTQYPESLIIRLFLTRPLVIFAGFLPELAQQNAALAQSIAEILQMLATTPACPLVTWTDIKNEFAERYKDYAAQDPEYAKAGREHLAALRSAIPDTWRWIGSWRVAPARPPQARLIRLRTRLNRIHVRGTRQTKWRSWALQAITTMERFWTFPRIPLPIRQWLDNQATGYDETIPPHYFTALLWTPSDAISEALEETINDLVNSGADLPILSFPLMPGPNLKQCVSTFIAATSHLRALTALCERAQALTSTLN